MADSGTSDTPDIPASAGGVLPLPIRTALFILAAAMPLVVIYARQSPEYLAPIAFFIVFAYVCATRRFSDLVRLHAGIVRDPVFLVLAIFLFWCLVSTAWSIDGGSARLIFLGLYLTCYLGTIALFVISGYGAADRARFSPFARILVAAALVAALLILFELSTGLAVHGWLNSGKTDPARLNKAAILLGAYYWLAFLAVWRIRRFRLVTAIVVLVVPALFFSGAQSSAAALVAAHVAMVLVMVAPVAGPLLIAWGLTAMTIAAPLILGRLYGLLPQWVYAVTPEGTAQIRAGTWYWIQEPMRDKLPFGIGFDGSEYWQVLQQFADLPPEAVAALSTVAHPHSAPVQVWLELGVPGALLLSLLVYLVARRIGGVPASVRPFAAGLVTYIAAIFYISHGAWEIWWIGTVLAAAVLWVALKPEAG